MVVLHAAELLEPRRLLSIFYVDTNNPAASDDNPGTSIDAPLKTITQALDLASENNSQSQSDKILIAGGVYYEQPFVWPSDSGASATDRTIISAYVDPATGSYEPVYIDAAQPVTDVWTQDGTSDRWYLSDFTTETSGVWVDWSPSNDGPSLQQIGTYNAGYYDERTIAGSGVGDMYPGTYYGDVADSRLYVWLPDGSDPNDHEIEYADRAREMYEPGAPNAGGGYSYADYIDFVGLNLRHDNVYDTTGQQPGCAMYTEGDQRLIDCNIQWNAGVGVYLLGDSQMIDCVSSNNGANGVVGQGEGFSITGGEFDGNYWRQYTGGSNAAIKVVTNNPLSYGNIENTQIADNFCKGIWFDTCFENSVVSQITGNYIHDNDDAGIDIEASQNDLIANNIIVGNQADGIALNAAENVGIYNNTIAGNYGIAAIELDGGTRDQGSEYPGTVGMLNNSIENNIIVNNFTVYDLDVPTLAAGSDEVNNNLSDYNLFYRFGGPLHFTTGGTYLGSWGQTPSDLADWQADSGQDADSIVEDPLFLPGGTGAAAFEIGANSPAIGAGATLPAVPTDYYGNHRTTAAYSIGAIDYVSGGNGLAGAIVTNTDPDIWVDDQLPDNAAMTAPDQYDNLQENRFWLWTNSNVHSGAAALDSTAAAGAHRQYFSGADPRAVGGNDILSAYVWIDPNNLPQEIMFEWQDSGGSWAHQAYWGQNVIDGGVDGSVAGQYMGDLPTAGQWVLLSVPASTVGLAGADITGFSFDLYDGRALLDQIATGPAPTANTLNVDSGTYRFAPNAPTANPDLIVNVAAGASVTFAAIPGEGVQTYTLAQLNLAAGSTVTLDSSDSSSDLTALIVSALTFDETTSTPQGLLNLNNNDLIVRNGDPNALTAALASGFAGGTWAGTGGIVSAVAAADTASLTAVGLATGMSGTFDTETVVPTDVELKYTYYGDANLDGHVDGSDYSLIDNGFNNALTGWFNGDFNYDGSIDGTDYTLIDNAFNLQGVALSSTITAARPSAMVTTTTVPAGVLASLTQADYLAVDPTLGTVAGEQKTIHEFAWAETVVTVTPPVDHSVAAGQDKIYRLVSRSNSKRFMNERHPGSRTRAIKLSAELADGSLTST